MNRTLPRLLPVLLLVAGSSLASASTQVRLNDVQVQTVRLYRSTHGQYRREHGYALYRFVVTNSATDKTHRVRLVMPAEIYGSGDKMRRIERTVTVESGGSVIVNLYQHPLPLAGDGVAVFVDGHQAPGLLEVEELEPIRREFWKSPDPLCLVLKSPGTWAELGTWLYRSRPSKAINITVFDSEIAVEAWPAHWLGYSAFDAVAVTGGELQAMTAQTRQALRQWTECGGVLLVTGSWPDKAQWMASQAEQAVCGFGFIWHLSEPRPPLEQAVSAIFATRKGCVSNLNLETADKNFRVRPEGGITVRGLMVIVLLFCLLLGPVNLLVLSRLGKRMWMLWTVPACSLLFCGLVFAYGFLSEGIAARVRTTSLTLLDQASRRATTLGLVGYYCPMTPGGGLRFSDDVELQPLLKALGPFGRSEGLFRTVNWTSRQHLESGWIRARMPAYLRVRCSQAGQRRRLEVTADHQGRLFVLNGLAVDIQELWIALDRQVYRPGPVPAGRKVPLGRPVATVNPYHTLRQAFDSKWIFEKSDLATHPLKYLQADSYIAHLAGQPFLETGLENVGQQRDQALVFGLLGPYKP